MLVIRICFQADPTEMATALAAHMIASAILFNLDIALGTVLNRPVPVDGRTVLDRPVPVDGHWFPISFAVVLMGRLTATKTKLCLTITTRSDRYSFIVVSPTWKESPPACNGDLMFAIGSHAPSHGTSISIDKGMQHLIMIFGQEMRCHLFNLHLRQNLIALRNGTRRLKVFI
jgi:hypothetical protein